MREAKWRKYALVAIILIIILAIIAVYLKKGEVAQTEVAARVVELNKSDFFTVKPIEILDTQQISGFVLPETTLQITSPISGTIKEVAVKAGQPVKEGQLLVSYDQALLNASLQGQKAAVEAAKAQVANAEKVYQNALSLSKQGYLSKIDLSNRQQSLLTAQAQLKRANADLDNSLKSFSQAKITAPFDGVIAAVNIKDDQNISTGAQVLTLVNLSKLELQTNVLIAKIAKVHVGTEVKLTALGLDGKSFAGKVSRISPVTSNNSLSVPLYVEIDNKDAALRGGSFVSGYLVLDRYKDVIAVAPEWIFDRRNSDGSLAKIVYAAVDGKLAVFPVTLGRSWEGQNLVEIKTGVKAGDKILTVPLQPQDIGVPYKVIGDLNNEK